MAQPPALAPAQPPAPRLGLVPWLDTPELRQWFANWLLQGWTACVGDSLDTLLGRSYAETYDGINTELKCRARVLPLLTTAEQLATFSALAAKFGLRTSRDEVLFELEYFLKREGHTPANKAAYQASPWCNSRALDQHIWQQQGFDLPFKHYREKSEGDLRLAFENLLTEFGSYEIHRSVSPPLRVRREQRTLYFAVRRILRLNDNPRTGPKGLAIFLATLLRE